jgi:hypothetical protein
MSSSPAPEGSEGDRVIDAERTRRRNRLLVGAGLLCFVVGVPLVSLPDGTALSVIGLSLETVAGACVISFIYLLAGDQHEPDIEEDELAGDGNRSGGGEDWSGGGRDGLAGEQDSSDGSRHEPRSDGGEE